MSKLQLARVYHVRSAYEATKQLRRHRTTQLEENKLVLKVTTAGTPRGLRLHSTADDDARTRARDIAAEYVRVLRERLEELRLTEGQRKRVFLEQRVAEAKQELEAATEVLAAAEAEHGTPDLEASTTNLIDDLAALQSELHSAKVAEREATESMAEVSQRLGQTSEMVRGSIVRGRSQTALQLERRLAELQTKLATLRSQGMTEEHPEYQAALAEAADVEGQYLRELQRGLTEQSTTTTRSPLHDQLLADAARYAVALEAARARRSALEAIITRREAEVGALPPVLREYAKLRLDAELKTTIYKTLVQDYELARVQEREEAPAFYVVDPPTVPQEKVGPAVFKTTVLAGLLAAVLGLIIALSTSAAAAPQPDASVNSS